MALPDVVASQVYKGIFTDSDFIIHVLEQKLKGILVFVPDRSINQSINLFTFTAVSHQLMARSGN